MVQIQQQAEGHGQRPPSGNRCLHRLCAGSGLGDTEGEKNANTNAQKAAKKLATAIEHNRRQRLISNAREQELVIVDQHIAEAQMEHIAIQRTALLLVEKGMEDQWNEKAQALMDIGAKLWAAQRLLGGDQLSLRMLVLPKEGEGLDRWGSRELSYRSYKFTLEDILSL